MLICNIYIYTRHMTKHRMSYHLLAEAMFWLRQEGDGVKASSSPYTVEEDVCLDYAKGEYACGTGDKRSLLWSAWEGQTATLLSAKLRWDGHARRCGKGGF